MNAWAREKELGRDTIVCAPLRICSRFFPGLRETTNQRKLRKLLRTVPLYAKLLDEYPGSRIHT